MDDVEGKLFATFEKHGEFSDLQRALLENSANGEALSEEEDANTGLILQKLSMILNEYHEQSYLLDPYLESLLVPVVNRLKYYATLFSRTEQPSLGLVKRTGHIANLLYYYINFRGYKMIVRYFPHEILDLGIALDCVRKLPDEHSEWPSRYVLLIWLSLICMIPFDLSQFDESDQAGTIATKLENVAKAYLGKAGLERDGASLLLSRLYTRKDTGQRFPSHLLWTVDMLTNGQDAILSIGALRVICHVVKDGPADVIREISSKFLSICSAIDGNVGLQNNTHIQKLKYKLLARVGMRLLPPARRDASRGKQLVLVATAESHVEVEEVDVPLETEHILQQLFEGLQDRDTIVRWSASKGVARVAERLPAAFSEQVIETVLNLFSVHFIAVTTLYDLPAIAEHTWHGACLACAEMARRGLIPHSKLSELLDWLSQALYFDLRKGAHSIGSNVRDAAAYVLWSIARTQTPPSLAPHAESLARHLVTVSLFDREVHVRRAASAAFQEFVGRTALFPSGIDVLRKTDFYAVSIRRNAYLEAASQVAEHREYRTALIEHLLNVPLRHWDLSMRELASQSLRRIMLTDFKSLFRVAFDKAVHLLESVDTHDLHGALLALTEIAKASELSGVGVEERDSLKNEVFASLSITQDKVLFGHSYDVVAAAALRLIAHTLMPTHTIPASHLQAPRWKKIIEFGLKHRNSEVQEAAAEAMGSVITLIRELVSSAPVIQQSLGRFLGALRYDVHPLCIEEILDTLLECVTPVKRFSIEAQVTCYQAMSRLVLTVTSCLRERVTGVRFRSMFRTMINGLSNYTNDERGDVGSWIRVACIKGLSSISVGLLTSPSITSDVFDYLPPELYQKAIVGILKQGVERLDNVRQIAGECFIALLKLPLPVGYEAVGWKLPGSDTFQDLLLSQTELGNWSDSTWFFPKAVRFLQIADFRNDILAGIVMSVGSKTDSIHRPMVSNLIAYIETLPVVADRPAAFDASGFVESLILVAEANFSTNSVIVPVFQIFNALLESDVIQRMSQYSLGLQRIEHMFEVALKNVSRIKNVARVQESMRMVVNLMAVPSLFRQRIPSLKPFFLHRVPKIRMDTAEYFYLKMQSTDSLMDDSPDEIEAVILETEWMSNDQRCIEDAFGRIIACLGVT